MNFKSIVRDILGTETSFSFAMDAEGDEDQGVVNMKKHDAKYHPDGYEEGDSCKYREQLAKGDIVDILDPENVDGEDVQYKKFSKGKHRRKGQVGGAPKSEPTGTEEVASGSNEPSFTNNMSLSDMSKAMESFIDSMGVKLNEMLAAYEKKFEEEQEANGTGALTQDETQQVDSCLNNVQDPFIKSMLESLVKSCVSEMKPKSKSPEQMRMEMLCRQADKINVDLRAAVGSGGNYGADKKRLRELKLKKQELDNKIDEIKEMMKLASPTFAPIMEETLEELEKEMKTISDELAGKKHASKIDEETTEKVEKPKGKQKKQELTLDSINDVSAKGAAILSDKDFKSIYDSLPEADKVLAVSDLHESDWKEKLKFKGRGTILIAGDMGDKGSTSIGSNRSMEQAVPRGRKWLEEKFLPYLESHKEQKFVIMPGNRDHYLSDPSMADIKWPENVSFVQDSEVNVNGMKVYGLPWCEQRKMGSAGGFDMSDPEQRAKYYDHPIGKRPYEISDEKLKEYCDKVPEGLDVLMVHYPPKFEGYDGDMAKGQHCGSQIVADMIKRVKPKLVICGHLHDGDHRPFKVDGTTIVNVAYSTDAGGSHSGAGGYHARQIGAIRDNGNTGFILNGEKKMEK